MSFGPSGVYARIFDNWVHSGRAMSDSQNCWEIKKCSAALYLNCKAYLEQKHCWDISNPRCSRSMLLCIQMGCPVYDNFMDAIDNEVEYRLKLMFPFLSSIGAEQETSQD